MHSGALDIPARNDTLAHAPGANPFMKVSSFHSIMEALAAVKVRYIVVGGIAVIEHGYLRLTRDTDIVIELNRDNIVQTFKALADGESEGI